MKDNNQIVLPKISEELFWEKLKKRKYEDIDAIKNIENFLIKKRGYIFKMPKAGSSVILLVSGGLDSTITWALLMDYFKLKVYPLFFHRGIKRWKKEKKALDFFSNLYSKKYPNYFVKPYEISVNLPIPEFEKFRYHPQFIFENLKMKKNNFDFSKLELAQTIQPYLYPFLGLNYAYFLKYTQNININTVFNSVLPGDGTVVFSQTFTALRSTLLSFCLGTFNFNWQFASPVFEKEIGLWIEKSDLIKIGEKFNLPLNKTWSCYYDYFFQCGECLTCFSRRLEFKKAGVKDKTLYITDIKKFIRNIKIKIKDIKILLKNFKLIYK